MEQAYNERFWGEAGEQDKGPQGRRERSVFAPSGATMIASMYSPLPWWKRSLDILFILVLLPILAAVSFVVALIVRLGSPGPIIFRQRRVGYRGSEFTIFKFRTMKPDAETDSHRAHTRQLIQSEVPMTKLDAQRDPRLIPFGSILRSSGLDELPQLLNVLRGEMSLVGPRPCIRYEYDLYDAWQKRRFEAVPGLTGLWQVSGKNHTTFQEMIALDIRYAETASFWLDLKIITKTPAALLQQLIENRVTRKRQRKRETILAEETIVQS
jgi:lipopolysaccharide/colanic/teichoic acid biosynthesis glycosyltransferase